MIKLTKEEKDILDSYERGEWKTSKNFSSKKNSLEAAARETLKKNKRVNIRISERDLLGIQKRAIEEGIPYQTLIASIIHKYNTGKLVDK